MLRLSLALLSVAAWSRLSPRSSTGFLGSGGRLAGRGALAPADAASARRTGSARRAAGDKEQADSEAALVGEAPAAPRRAPASKNARLLKEVMGSTPGLARSSAPASEQGEGGIMLFFPPERRQSVTFALWFGPFPCFQFGTFRYCF
uniref:Uncharacterized protein n=1 Tax=Alexandrium catenella TaxID=2925 RepID=A0A7S1WGV0_ALECA